VLLHLLTLVHHAISTTPAHHATSATPARLSFPDTKDLCTTLLTTFPTPIDNPESVAVTSGCYAPQDDAFACIGMALSCIVTMLTRCDIASPPWLALQSAVLARVSTGLRCLHLAACCADLPVDTTAAAIGDDRAATSLIGLLARLCSSVLQTHERSLRAVSEVGDRPENAATAQSQGPPAPVQLLSVLQQAVYGVLYPAYALHVRCTLEGGGVDGQAGVLDLPLSTTTSALVFSAVACLLDVVLGGDSGCVAPTPLPAGGVHGQDGSRVHRATEFVSMCVQEGLLQHVFMCAL
jgi:hypothetical protein